MPENTFQTFLVESLALLEQDFAVGHAALARALGPREVAIEVDGESLAVVGDGKSVQVRRSVTAACASAALGRGVLVDLLEARTTLVDAASAGRFELTGALPDLLAFHDALTAYFGSAARCPSFPRLLQAFLGEP